MKKVLLFFGILFLQATTTWAQKEIKGQIIDIDNNPLNEATVSVKNTDIKVITDMQGFFKIEIPEEKTNLVILKEGFYGKDIVIGKDSLTIILYKKNSDLLDISLEELLQIKIKGASQYAQNVSDVPANVMVITKEQIRYNGYDDLSDVLKDLPGFDIIENASRFGEYYTIRGINGNDRFLVLINGRKINAASGWYLTVGNSFSVKNLERIEVIYGASSIMYGSDAFSAIINLVPVEPENKSIDISVEHGSFNSNQISASTALKFNDDWSFTANARFYHSDGFAFADTGIYSNIKSYKTPLTPEFEQPINDHDIYAELKYKNFRLGYYNRQFSEGNARGLNPSSYVFNEQNTWKLSDNLFWLNHQFNTASNGTFSTDISYHQMDLNSSTQFYKISFLNNVQTLNSQYMTGSDHAIKINLNYHQIIGEKLDFITGCHYENITSIPAYANDELYGKTTPKYTGLVKDSIDENLKINENKFAIFGQFSYKFIPSLRLIAGARYEISERYDDSFNPRVSLNFTPTQTTTIKLIYGSAFQAPSLFYQFEQFGIPSLVMIPAKEKLRNQNVQSGEITFSQKIKNKLMLDLSLFYNKGKNLIQRVNLDKNDTTWNKYFNKYTPQVQNQNIGEQTAWGIQFSGFADVNNHIKAFFNYTYTDATYKENNQTVDLPRVAKHKANLAITFTNLCNRFTIRPSINWVGKVTTPQNTIIYQDDKQADSYLYLNLMLLAKVTKMFEIYCHLNNLLDDQTPHVGLYTKGVYTEDIPQPGFSFNAGIRFTVKN